jgi:hypothetical protein
VIQAPRTQKGIFSFQYQPIFLQAISKKPFVPNSLLEANVKSSKLGTRSKRVGSERSKEILEYVCGLTLASASILNQNPFFEIACNDKDFILS